MAEMGALCRFAVECRAPKLARIGPPVGGLPETKNTATRSSCLSESSGAVLPVATPSIGEGAVGFSVEIQPP